VRATGVKLSARNSTGASTAGDRALSGSSMCEL
jgi:hypothetical protein